MFLQTKTLRLATLAVLCSYYLLIIFFFRVMSSIIFFGINYFKIFQRFSTAGFFDRFHAWSFLSSMAIWFCDFAHSEGHHNWWAAGCHIASETITPPRPMSVSKNAFYFIKGIVLGYLTNMWSKSEDVWPWLWGVVEEAVIDNRQ